MLYREEHCSSADEFMSCISLSKAPFLLTGKYDWLFRGQAEPASLIPSAWRPGALAAFNDGKTPLTYADTVRLERTVVGRFFMLADARGLALPEDTQAIRRQIWLGERLPDEVEWPPAHWHSLLALAQHHRLPTRLLDWTWNTYVAAYFAASEAADGLRKGSRNVDALIAVYALSQEVGNVEWLRRHHEQPLPPGAIELVTAPPTTNRNLHAQEGVFTLLIPNQGKKSPLPNMSVDGYVQALRSLSPRTLLYRFTVETGHAEFLLHLLRCEGVSASSVSPGYDGVAREVIEERRPETEE